MWLRLANWCVPPEALSLGERRLSFPLPDYTGFDPGPCPKCGQRDYRINWLDVSDGPFYEAIPGTVECLNPGCEWGPRGTTPSGETGETWVSKLPTD